MHDDAAWNAIQYPFFVATKKREKDMYNVLRKRFSADDSRVGRGSTRRLFPVVSVVGEML